ncbi:MAG: hypothetical protein WAK55_27980 [Xanthobacteraceae bacterium]
MRLLTKLPPIQRVSEERLDRVAFVGAVATSIGVEVAVHFERIELRVGDVDRQATDAMALVAKADILTLRRRLALFDHLIGAKPE